MNFHIRLAVWFCACRWKRLRQHYAQLRDLCRELDMASDGVWQDIDATYRAKLHYCRLEFFRLRKELRGEPCPS